MPAPADTLPFEAQDREAVVQARVPGRLMLPL